MSRAWFALAVAGMLGRFYVGYGLQSGPRDGVASGQEVKVQPLFNQPAAARKGLEFRYLGSPFERAEVYRSKIPGGWLIGARTNTGRDANDSIRPGTQVGRHQPALKCNAPP